MGINSISAVPSATDPNMLTINLGSQWTLFIDEKNSQIIIQNNLTGGRSTRIWGDPHVDLNNDGTNDFDFWNQTTFNLEGGGKITFETEPWQGNANMFVVRRILVTYGNDAMLVDGISQNRLGDLKHTMFTGQAASIDAALADGDGFNLGANGQLTTHSGDLVINQQSSGITGFRADANEFSSGDLALRNALYQQVSETGLLGAMQRIGVNVQLCEGDYNLAAATSTSDLAGLMTLQASLSRLGMVMQSNTGAFDKVISVAAQSSQKIMQS
ncbi:DUF1521 domain-containing protein [Limnobacter humi]|uniref:DUF1521 domain-containing protein n=1 Tax=Limnobacter humi TaxID=1778671 RepID=A0ABT1WDD1_9BURK|nr:DUF1521 domain-containing protein [Limnobacter humi]MCQ8895530.1 DUF1521 domain-containing protein [Limnobacter humi]